MTSRKKLPLETKIKVLAESGYRCAVPTCRTILALDLHHILEVAEGGGNSCDNLICLCPTCHALYHRGDIHREAIVMWKGMLVSLTKAFDLRVVDTLLMLDIFQKSGSVFEVSGDGLLNLNSAFSSGLLFVEYHPPHLRYGINARYVLNLSAKGKALVSAWKQGDRSLFEKSLRQPENVTEAP